VASPRVVNIEDLRPLARLRLPKVVFDYIDGASVGELDSSYVNVPSGWACHPAPVSMTRIPRAEPGNRVAG
jgi:hypothetical protein